MQHDQPRRRRTARQAGGGASEAAPSIGGSDGKRFCGATRCRQGCRSSSIREGMSRFPPDPSLVASKVGVISLMQRPTTPQQPCAVLAQQKIRCGPVLPRTFPGPSPPLRSLEFRTYRCKGAVAAGFHDHNRGSATSSARSCCARSRRWRK